MFRRALAGQQLAPVERAILRLIEGLVATALVAALPIIADALAQQSVNWGSVLRTALAAAGVAVLLALAKYARAHGDAPVGQALEMFAATVPARLGVNDVKLSGETPASAPASAGSPDPAPGAATAPVTATAGG